MSYVRPVAIGAIAYGLCWFGLWWIVAIGCMAGVLFWLKNSGPDDPEPEPIAVTQLRRRQLDQVCERDQIRRR